MLAVAALLPCGKRTEGLSFSYKKRNNQIHITFNLDSTGGLQRSLGRLLLELNCDSGFASLVGWLWLAHGQGCKLNTGRDLAVSFPWHRTQIFVD